MQQADSLRAVLDHVFQSGAYDWAPDRDPWTWLRQMWSALVLWLQELQQVSPWGFRLLAYGAVLLLLLIVGHTLWVFLRTIRTGSPDSPGPALPTPPLRDAHWFREEARRLANTGQYRAAVEADFRALLLSLEERAVLKVQPSTTPAEYARTINLPPAERAAFEETVHRLYGYLFARRPCGPAEYYAWQQAADPDRYAPAH